MKSLPPEVERLVEAHRVAFRPDADLRQRVRDAVEEDRRRMERRRWIGGAAVGATLALAAMFVLHCTLRSPAVLSVHHEVGPHGASYERDGVTPEPSAARTSATSASPSSIEVDASAEATQVSREPASIRTPQPSSRVDPPRPSAPLSDDPAREVRLLRDAEVVLREDPSAALALLEAHEREFPSSTLAVEREALTVLALCGAGRLVEGRGRRAAFSRSHPTSVYAARVRAACEDR